MVPKADTEEGKVGSGKKEGWAYGCLFGTVVQILVSFSGTGSLWCHKGCGLIPDSISPVNWAALAGLCALVH